VFSTIRNGSRVVVDDGGILGAGQLAKQGSNMIVPFAALAVGRSNSKATASRIAAVAASIAASASRARPRLVVQHCAGKVNSGRRLEASAASSWSRARLAISSAAE